MKHESGMKTIETLFRSAGLGEVIPPVVPVPGGLLHRTYRVCTRDGCYAVKHLNPEIMKRPGVLPNYRRAEELEQILEDAGIPVVPALAVNGRKMQETDGAFFYIFRWHSGRVTDWNQISAEQCRRAGSVLGRIHALEPRAVRAEPAFSSVDWAGYTEEAVRQGSGIARVLKENEGLLTEAVDALNRARLALPDVECITDGDMDPKNVLWENGEPFVVDLECLSRGNPVSHALQLSLQWAGVTTCSLDPGKQTAFFDGYLEAWDNGFRDYGSVLGVAYTWVEWLEYNVRRALGCCRDEAERETGAAEVFNTVRRIRHIRGQEALIRQTLERLPR